VGWHGVSLIDEHERFTSLFISVERLRQRLDFLHKNYKIISLDEAVKQHRSGRIQPHQAVLTFDDGYYNFLVRAAPLLKEFSATATIYVVSSAMVNQEPFYNMILRDAILATTKQQAVADVTGLNKTYPLETSNDREHFKTMVLEQLRSFSQDNPARARFSQTVCKALDVDYDELCRQRVWHSLNREEVRHLSEEGFSMQLHTHTHANLAELSDTPEGLRQEISTCRQLLEDTTGKEASHLCFPSTRWSYRVLEIIEGLGLKSGVVGGAAPNFVKTPALTLRRFFDGQEQTQLEFESETSGLRFLFHAMFNWERWYKPSERIRSYKEMAKE